MSAGAVARTRLRWPALAAVGLAGLFYAYAVWTAVAFLISQATGPLGLNGLGWALLISAIVFPIVAYVVAVRVGSRRPLWQLALVMLLGLCLVAVFWLNVVGYAVVSGASLLGG